MSNKLIFILLATLTAVMALADNHLPRVYLEVSFWPKDYMRTEADFVDYVRDRENADVHVLGIRTRTGGSGSQITLTFYGHNEFEGQNDTLIYNIYANENGEAERSCGLANLKLGLLPYILQSSGAPELLIDIQRIETDSKHVTEIEDPWNGWVYKIGGRINMSGEESRTRFNTRDHIGAKWIGDAFKCEFSAHGEFDKRLDQLTDDRGTDAVDDDSTYQSVSTSSNYGFQYKAGWSLSDHWSFAVYTGIYGNSVQNIDRSMWINPALEYNLFPYSESTRRQFRIGTKIVPNYLEYVEETIYDKNKELLWSSEIEFDLRLMQPWGSVDAGVTLSTYLHDFSKNHARFYTHSNFKLWKGLSLNTQASISLIRNQLFLSKSGLDLADIYLERKAVATNYRYGMYMGLTYTFGSIYKTAVNQRFGYW